VRQPATKREAGIAAADFQNVVQAKREAVESSTGVYIKPSPD